MEVERSIDLSTQETFNSDFYKSQRKVTLLCIQAEIDRWTGIMNNNNNKLSLALDPLAVEFEGGDWW